MRQPPLPRRLPGVRFEVPPPAPDEALPRMDIACFVGFASRGPLERAMAVESLLEFEAVYGNGITLARDGRSGETVRGLLHPCVRSFFSQGGRRCWILRVAGAGVETSVFPLPGLLRSELVDDAWHDSPAALRAASAGSGADTLRLAARLDVALLRARPLSMEGGTLQLRADAAAAALRDGDLLRIEQDGLRVHGRIAALHDEGLQLRIVLRPLRALRALAGSAALQLQGLETLATTGASPAAVAAEGEWLGALLQAQCRLPAPWPQPGEVLRLLFRDERSAAWMAVEAVDLLEAPDPGGLPLVLLRGRPWQEASADTELAAWCANGAPQKVQRLRLDLQVREGTADPVLARDLAMSALPGTAALGLSDPLRFPVVGNAGAEGSTLWLPLAELPGFDAGLGPLPSQRLPVERDGLADFDWDLFAEPALQHLPGDVLADQASALRLAGSVPRPLRGLHALLGGQPEALADEPTLLAVPDAVHPGWDPSPPPPAWKLLAPLPEPADPGAGEPFHACDAEPLPAPQPVPGAEPDAGGNFTLHWTPVLPGAVYLVEESGDASFAAASVLYQGTATRFTVLGKPPGEVFFRVRATLGPRRSGWSQRVQLTLGVPGYVARDGQSATLLEVHRLMLQCAAARGDVLALLALPEAFDTAAAAQHAKRLRERVDDGRTLSHGALYHPWIVIRRVEEILRFPPDGAACGQLAAGALRRGAWIAVANGPLRDVVALTPPGMAPLPGQRQQLLDAQVNLLRSAPHGFVCSSADTLTPDSAWRPINVRRLMCLLRRLALRRGTTYVFEPNGPALRRTVERSFSALLDDLFRRGAFVGARAADAYRVEAGDEVNTPQRRDAGQFWVQLKVAPALPLSFLTVRLAREGERVISRELH